MESGVHLVLTLITVLYGTTIRCATKTKKEYVSLNLRRLHRGHLWEEKGVLLLEPPTSRYLDWLVGQNPRSSNRLARVQTRSLDLLRCLNGSMIMLPLFAMRGAVLMTANHTLDKRGWLDAPRLPPLPCFPGSSAGASLTGLEMGH